MLFPKTIDNSYRGNKLPLYFFYLLATVTIGRSLAHMFLADGGAQSIATIPLDSYSKEASDVVIHIFSEWGLTQLMFGILYGVVLWRYKTLIPLMYLFIFIEYSGRLFLTVYKPIVLEGTAPGGILNYVMIPVALIMLFLSLRTQTDKK
ncbi:hypothetical protein EI427_00745 [Flammeovirga pectinis]|uniref:DUF4345 domain-containing protein n=1 Tax=Flammeovirga pectinis TaxID=2494373 RepID=A0A3Q9FL79_9BACT|nr:hypothetical protein [Flammeovirga pectinis]AZQ60788.1 hypothetical protein EI427_00745 [Flammeovirga pectinis]